MAHDERRPMEHSYECLVFAHNLGRVGQCPLLGRYAPESAADLPTSQRWCDIASVAA